MNFIDRLNECSDFPCVFELVKLSVEIAIGKRRVGLMLGLADLPNYVGAFHQIGSNFIVMNKRLLTEVMKTSNKRLVNAYIFHVLLHEYIHSLGCVDERETQLLTHAISEKVFGPDHPVTQIAKYGIGSVFAGLRLEHHEPRNISEIEIIDDFERDNLNYFG